MSEPLEIVVKTTGVKEATKALDDLAVAGGKAEKSATKIGESSKGASDKIAELGRKAGAIDPVANALNKAEKASITASGSMNRLSRSVAGAAVEAAGLTRGMGALSGIAGTLGEVLGLGVVGAALAAVAAFKYLQDRAEQTRKAVEANNEAWRASKDALDATKKYTDAATASTNLYAGSLGNAADKALALARGNKEAAISSLLLARAELGKTTDNSQALTTEGLWERANKKSWNPREIAAGIGATFAAGAALFDGPGQDRLKNSIKSNQNQMKAIEDQILALNKLDINAFADKVTAGAGRSAKALKEVSDSLKDTFVSAEYMQAWQDLQDARAKRAVVAMKPIDVPGLKNDAAEVGEALAKELEDAAEAGRRAFNQGLDDFENSIRNRDWLSAFAGLFSAIDALNSRWKKLSTEDRISGVASIASSVGSAVGGTGGRALGGAASGAMAGLTLTGGNPIGAAIGAIVGGALSLFSSSSAKKQAKADAERQRLENEASIAIQTANQFRSIEIERLTLLGDATAVRALQLEGERAGIAASNLARFDELVALREEAGLRELRIQLLEAEGKTAEASAMRQTDALNLLTPAQQDLTKQIWAATDATNARLAAEATYAQAVADADAAITKAQGDLTSARQAETQSLRDAAQEQAQAAQSMISRLNGITASLQAFNESAGGGLSYATADARFRDVSSRARLGDLDAGEKAASTFSELLAVSKTTSTSAIQYQRDVARTRLASDAILAVTGRQTSIAQQQLDAANGQLAALQTLNETALSVAQATANLAAALGVKAKLTGVANDNSGAYSSSASKADMDRAGAAGIGVSGPAGNISGYLIDMYRSGAFDHLRDEFGNPTGVAAQLKAAGFSTGGSGTVGGSGGPDSQLVPLRLTPGELVNVSKGDSFAALLAETRALRQEMASMRVEQAKTTAESKKTADTLTFVTRGGKAMQTEAA